MGHTLNKALSKHLDAVGHWHEVVLVLGERRRGCCDAEGGELGWRGSGVQIQYVLRIQTVLSDDEFRSEGVVVHALLTRPPNVSIPAGEIAEVKSKNVLRIRMVLS